MIIPFDREELSARIALNRHRLTHGDYYQPSNIFSPPHYDWYGDKEGRALLAFVSHYKIDGTQIPCMETLLHELPAHTNEQGYLGPHAPRTIREQQLSGHSWLLRGLCEHYEQFGDDASLHTIRDIVEHLYLPTRGRYHTYPIHRNTASGGVSGHTAEGENGWQLSTDIGCAFMSIDGLSHAYRITHDARIAALVEEMSEVYAAIDKLALRAQTHCTLTAARGMMRMYDETGEGTYLARARDIYRLYTEGGGMTDTYQNLNWWGRPDSWTEPCAIIDSLMLAILLYRTEGREEYRRMATRIWRNGFASLQRDNGGAGTDYVVLADRGQDTLSIHMYEAEFCCTMRLAEGLWFLGTAAEHLYAEIGDEVTRDERGIYRRGDDVYAACSDEGKPYADHTVTVDGYTLSPLLKFYKIPKETAHKIRQRIVF